MKEYYTLNNSIITTNVQISVKRDNEKIKGGLKNNSEKSAGQFTGKPNQIQVKVEILENKTEIFETKTEIINREKIQTLSQEILKNDIANGLLLDLQEKKYCSK